MDGVRGGQRRTACSGAARSNSGEVPSPSVVIGVAWRGDLVHGLVEVIRTPLGLVRDTSVGSNCDRQTRLVVRWSSPPPR